MGLLPRMTRKVDMLTAGCDTIWLVVMRTCPPGFDGHVANTVGVLDWNGCLVVVSGEIGSIVVEFYGVVIVALSRRNCKAAPSPNY